MSATIMRGVIIASNVAEIGARALRQAIAISWRAGHPALASAKETSRAQPLRALRRARRAAKMAPLITAPAGVGFIATICGRRAE